MQFHGRRRVAYYKPCLFKALKPKLLLVLLLIFCWDVRNGIECKGHHFGKFSPHQLPSHLNPHQKETILARLETLREQLGHHPDPPNQSPLRNSLTTSSSNDQIDSEADAEDGKMDGDNGGAFVGPFFGNLDIMPSTNNEKNIEIRRKKNCGMPSVAQRGMLGSVMRKRDFFAFDEEEMRRKRDLDNIENERINKRSGNEITTDGPLPWACATTYMWNDIGVDSYPRFVRTAECKSRSCFNGFFKCRAKKYKTKVLKRVTGTGGESVSCEEDDVSLPDGLRNNWKFVTVTINLCCDCTGRLTPADK